MQFWPVAIVDIALVAIVVIVLTIPSRRFSKAQNTPWHSHCLPIRMHITNQTVLTPPNAVVEPVLQKQLALLLESTGEGIYGIDMEGRCTFINRAAADMIGCEPDEALGRNMHEVTHHSHPDGRPYAEHDCPIFNAFRQGLPCR